MTFFIAFVAASAAACLVAALVKGGGSVLGLPVDGALLSVAASGFVLAFATWRAQAISAFLRIFSVVFAAEYAVVALAFAAASLGFWPQALAPLTPPPNANMNDAAP